MNIDPIKNGIVIDHITAGSAMKIYSLLRLGTLTCPVALICNVQSRRMVRKDIIKIDSEFDIDLDLLGYVDPGATVNIIRNGIICEKKRVGLPERLTDVIKCRNPRCITSTEQELPQIFRLTDAAVSIAACTAKRVPRKNKVHLIISGWVFNSPCAFVPEFPIKLADAGDYCYCIL